MVRCASSWSARKRAQAGGHNNRNVLPHSTVPGCVRVDSLKLSALDNSSAFLSNQEIVY